MCTDLNFRERLSDSSILLNFLREGLRPVSPHVTWKWLRTFPITFQSHKVSGTNCQLGCPLCMLYCILLILLQREVYNVHSKNPHCPEWTELRWCEILLTRINIVVFARFRAPLSVCNFSMHKICGKCFCNFVPKEYQTVLGRQGSRCSQIASPDPLESAFVNFQRPKHAGNVM